MICPTCGHDNIDGADICAECQHDLTFLDTDPAIQSYVERLIIREPISELKPASPICVQPATPLSKVITTLIDERIGCVLVVDKTELVGIFTERDVLLKVAGRESELWDSPVREFMTPNPETIERDDNVAFAMHKMAVGRYRHLPVMSEGHACGVISVRDVMRFLAEYLIVS